MLTLCKGPSSLGFQVEAIFQHCRIRLTVELSKPSSLAGGPLDVNASIRTGIEDSMKRCISVETHHVDLELVPFCQSHRHRRHAHMPR